MKRSADFLLRDVAGTLVVVPVGAAVAAFPGMITLNETAAYIWDLLEQEQTVDALVEAMAARYDAPTEKIREDVEALVERLKSVGAVV